jgi:hypothetical protein
MQELLHQRTAWSQLLAISAESPDLIALPQATPQLLRFRELEGPRSQNLNPAAGTSPALEGQQQPGGQIKPKGRLEEEDGGDMRERVRLGFARLAARCMESDPSKRPTFTDIVEELDKLRCMLG